MPARPLVGLLCLLFAGSVAAAPQQATAPESETVPRPALEAGTSASADALLVTLEAELAADPVKQATWLKWIALALASDPSPDTEFLQDQVATITRLRGERIAATGSAQSSGRIDSLLALMMIDPRRFAYDADFRANVVPVLRDGLAPQIPVAARGRMLRTLNRLPGFDFGTSERIEVAWGAARRASRSRELLFAELDESFGAIGPIHASIYSLPAYFDYEEAAAFLRGVHRIAPERDLVVLSNAPLIDELRPLAGEMRLHLVDALGRRYSAWPRDPFSVVRSPEGAVTFVLRPNMQAQREADIFMAREIIQGLPDELDEEWGHAQWTVAPIPFHGGHMLSTPGVTWISIHTLLPRIDEILGQEDTDIQKLYQPRELDRFLVAMNRAAAEFASVFNQPLRFVHPIPTPGDVGGVRAFQAILSGGDGRDLDSLVTILPAPDGGAQRALIADLTLGKQLLAAVPQSDLDSLEWTFDLGVEDDLRATLVDAQSTPRNEMLDAYLDAAAAYLQAQGIAVDRLPLVRVPTSMLPADRRSGQEDFLISWNNVVIEVVDGAGRAEGFSSGLPSIDELARDRFAAGGYELRYVPALVRSVIRDGGYRCSSSQVR